ncbi:MAG: hypothetical protein NC219_10330 [Prevotella sp.]|nr:hypothetical protein [Prevotella sp.]
MILYEQNGELFLRVHLGKADGGVEIFKNTDTPKVMFETLPYPPPRFLFSKSRMACKYHHDVESIYK